MKLTVVNIKDLKIRKSKDPVSLPLQLIDWTFKMHKKKNIICYCICLLGDVANF